MKRSGNVVVLAHCILDVSSKLRGLARYPGADQDLVGRFLADGLGMLQLPCPELCYLGLRRWGMTREQYDVPAYRRHCRQILLPAVDQIEALARGGCRITEVVGIDGSPNCGVAFTCFGFIGGEPVPNASSQRSERREGRGVFMEELSAMLGERGLSVPFSSVEE